MNVAEPDESRLTENLEQRLHKALDGHYALANERIIQGEVEEALEVFEQALKFRQAIERRKKVAGTAQQYFPSRRTSFFLTGMSIIAPIGDGWWHTQTPPPVKKPTLLNLILDEAQVLFCRYDPPAPESDRLISSLGPPYAT